MKLSQQKIKQNTSITKINFAVTQDVALSSNVLLSSFPLLNLKLIHPLGTLERFISWMIFLIYTRIPSDIHVCPATWCEMYFL
jgi:hypothetical protein